MKNTDLMFKEVKITHSHENLKNFMIKLKEKNIALNKKKVNKIFVVR